MTGLSNIAEIQLGDLFSCARHTDGTVSCWGDNSYYQLGDGLNAPQTRPQLVPGLTDVTDIDLGDSHVCVVKKDTSMWCWGRNQSNQQKLSGTTINTPTLVASAARGHRQALAGGDSSGTVRQDGSMQGAWVILDFFDVIVHVMRPDARERYDLEGLWGDAARVKAKSKPAKAKLTRRQASKKRVRKTAK